MPELGFLTILATQKFIISIDIKIMIFVHHLSSNNDNTLHPVCGGKPVRPIVLSLHITPTLCNLSTFCSRNLCALYHGRKTSFRTSLTPSSLNLRLSALTTGELTKYSLQVSPEQCHHRMLPQQDTFSTQIKQLCNDRVCDLLLPLARLT